MNFAFWLGLALCSLSGPGINLTKNKARFEPEPYSSASLIRFANGITIDINSKITTDQLPITKYWLVHFSRPLRQEWLEVLRKLGFEPVCYIAYQTVVARAKYKMNYDEVKRWLAGILGQVDWVGPFLPEYKLAPELRRHGLRRKPTGPLTVAFWPGETEACLQLGMGNFSVGQFAEREEVAWIQEAEVFAPFNRDVQWVLQSGWSPVVPDPIQGRRVWEKGIRGQGMIIGLFDSGINTEHDMFRDPNLPLEAPGVYPDHRKIVAYKLYKEAAFGDVGAVYYHGSGVAGTLAGNDAVCGNLSDLDGIAPEARIYFLDIATASGNYIYSDNLTEMLDSVRLGLGLGEPVRQISGSVGTSDYLGYYRLADATLDAVSWQDKKFLAVWAAGNSGGGRYKLGHPGCAKNCLTVGGCGNGTRSNLIYSLSSAGPTRDERIKPNIVAPAESISTVWGAGVNTYWVRDGTSFAAPAACGALALLRQYLKEGWFPFGYPDPSRAINAPSSALMRALALCATDTNVGAETIPDIRIGWGRLNLSQIMHFPDDSVCWTFVDETIGIETGQFDEYQVTIERRKPLRVVLAWTDTAGAPAAQIALVNDLNLELISPDNNRYRGNQLFKGASIPNPGVWDERNVEEVFYLPRPLTGVWRIRVYARNIYTFRQPYALVVKGNVGGITPGVDENPTKSLPINNLEQNIVNPKFSGMKIPVGTQLKVWTVNGRLVALINNYNQSELRWRFTDKNGERLPAGVYFYQLSQFPGKIQTGKITLVK
ncbi:MAG: S8 family serine peptidase [candidate division WOR-3 bacterium]